MVVVKDSQYWQVYNQKRKDYLSQKKRETRERLKMSTTSEIIMSTTEPLKVVDIEKVVDQNKNMSTTEKKLWKDYYSVKKPFCPNCLQLGIKENEYQFCSTKKQPVKVCEVDYWGKPNPNKVLHTFNEIYACSVYDWTIYQGQGKIQ